MSAPRAAVAVEELLGARRSPRAGGVVRERRPVALPRGHDRVHEEPLLLHLVRAREQRPVAQHRVEDEPLIRLRHPGSERAAVEEVHVHGADRHALPGNLGPDRERDALVRLHVHEEHVRAQPFCRRLLERRMRRALELDRDRRLAACEPLPHAHVERRVRPAPVVDVELRRDERLRHRIGSDALLLAVARDAFALDVAAPVLPAHDRLGPGRVERLQHLHLLAVHGVRLEVDRRLHRGQREALQQVVLEDVPDRACVFVVAGASLDPDLLGDGDLYVVDDLPVPDRLEHAVREAQREHVLHRLLAEIVVDPEDLALVEVLPEHLVELLRGGEVVTERLLDDQARPAGRAPALAERLDDLRERRRRNGEVVDAVPEELAVLVAGDDQLLQLVGPVLVGEVGREVVHVRRERIPDVLAELVARVLLHGLLHVLAPGIVRPLRAGHPDDCEPRRQELPEAERVQRRHQLLVREVARRAEDDERARLRRAPEREPLEERVVRYRDRDASLIAWPPNWLRSAAVTRAEKFCSSRDEKRAKSDAAITGTGTFSAIASWIVQRPSPESSTYGAMSSSFEPCSSNASWRSSSSHERTTEPYRQMPEICSRSRPNSECPITSKPSAYASIRPYSIPLCTIFTKWPAPEGPTCA